MEKGFWLKWTVINAVSFAIATPIAVQLTQFDRLESNVFAFFTTLFVFFGGAAALFGLITGAAQEVMLRKIVGGRHGNWTLATIQGEIVGQFLGVACPILVAVLALFLPEPFPLVLKALMATMPSWLAPSIGVTLLISYFSLNFGLGVGMCQRSVLHRVFANASDWIVISSLARALAGLVGYGGLVAFFLIRNEVFLEELDFPNPFMWAIAGLVGGTIYGLITGGAFHIILKRQHNTAKIPD